MQYVTSAALLISIFADYLNNNNQTLACGNTIFSPNDLMNFTKSQVMFFSNSLY